MTYNTRLRMNLSFFEGEKTEKPTAKKKRDARQKGQVAQSQEVGIAVLFVAVFAGIKAFAGGMFTSLLDVFANAFGMISNYDQYFMVETWAGIVAYSFLRVILISAPIFITAFVVGIVVNIIQVGWHPTTEPMKVKLSNLSPMKGLKRMFSMQAVVNFVKSLLKLGLIGIVVYNGIMARQNDVLKLVDMELGISFVYVANFAADLGLQVGFVYLIIAAVDFAYTRYKHNKTLKMSKQEVKDEWKQMEGDPVVKGKIKRKMLEVGMRRMMSEVPHADVIITNPTHFAVALKYDAANDAGAPVVVAKGVDFVAQRIKEKAKEADVPIVENKPLARTLYATVDVGREIPPELYAAVAEILSYVFKLKNRGIARPA